jgi:hypothetical protein
MGNFKPWNTVVFDNAGRTVDGRAIGNTPNHEGNAEVRYDDDISLGLGEQNGVGIEVVGPLWVHLLTRNVKKKIGGQRKKLLADKHVQGVNRGVSKEFVPVDFVVGLFGNAKVLAGLRNVYLITLHRSVVGMVTVMGDLPREVRSPQEVVSDEAQNIINDFVIRESTMAALMANNPNSSENKTLEPPVGTPSSPASNF